MTIQTGATLAELVRQARVRRGLSQAELGELARVSTKTIQRMEAGASVAGSSRRAVIDGLGIDPEEVALPDEEHPLPETPWTAVEDARSLWRQIAAARGIDVEIDREGWRRAWDERPWYKQGIVIAIATRDPVDEILEIVDEIPGSTKLPPGRLAKQQDDLTKALQNAGKLEWSLAYRVDGSGQLSLYLGSPADVTAKLGR